MAAHAYTQSYRWVIVVGGILGLFASLGLGRFALGMMLPAMGESLDLSYSQMGVISTVNLCGYLGAVLLSGSLVARFGSRLLISLALGLVSVSMILVGLAKAYLLILLLYFFTGVGSALSNVPIMALIAAWFDGGSRGRATGFCVMGNGLGILLTGQAVPVMNTMAAGWRISWIVLGVLAGGIALLCYLLFRTPSPDTGPSSRTTGVGQPSASGTAVGLGIFYYCGAIYFLFGFTYVIYVTFFVTSLVQDRGLTETAAGALWAWVGFISLASGPLFGYFSDRAGRKIALMTVFFIQTAAYLLVAVPLPMVAVYLSLGCFGLVVWSIPTIIAALVGDFAGPERTAAMFGLVTFLFGIGQIAGPAVAGVLAENTGSFYSSFLLSGVLVLLAMVMSFFIPRPTASR